MNVERVYREESVLGRGPTHPKMLEGLVLCRLLAREPDLPSNFSTFVLELVGSRSEFMEVADGLGEGGSAKESVCLFFSRAGALSGD